MKIAELRAPIRELPLGLACREPVSLPSRKVGVLNCRNRRRASAMTNTAAIERGQFVEQHVERPAVDDDMMGEQQQLVRIVREPKQHRAQQRTVHEIERQRARIA